MLKELFVYQCFFLSGNIEVRIKAHALKTNAIARAAIAIKEKSCLNPDNIIFGLSILASLKYT